MMRKKERGFTLVELMIVLMIIALLASISTVGALSMRAQANEATAKSSLRAMLAAAENYRVAQLSYPTDLATLGAAYLTGGLESGEKGGYVFELKSGNNGDTFTSTAVPKSQNYTGVKSYCVDTRGLIYVYDNSPALTADGSVCPNGGAPLQS